MGKIALFLSAMGFLAGCADQTPPVALLVHEVIATPRLANLPPNLALGPTADDARLGEWFAFRSDWPASDYGVRLEELSTYLDATYDDQAYYDRFGGAFFKVQSSTRTGVLVR
jgi:hypothetical protein